MHVKVSWLHHRLALTTTKTTTVSNAKSRSLKQVNLTSMQSRSALLLALLLAVLARAIALDQVATTKAFTAAEPIKWSFGGWAPLDGGPPGSGGQQNRSSAAQASAGGATSPLPAAPTRAPAAGSRANQTSRDALSESASSQQERMIHSGQHDLSQRNNRYSLPAPLPIVREHLFAQPQRHAHNNGPLMMAQQYSPVFRPPPFFERQQQMMHQQQQMHQAHIMHHQKQHQMMMASQQHPRPPYQHQEAQSRPMQFPMQRPHLMNSQPPRPPVEQQHQQQPSRSIPRYPGSPPNIHANRPVAFASQEQPGQPIMYSEGPPPHDRIPMIEVSAGSPGSYPNNNSAQAGSQLVMQLQEEKAAGGQQAELIHPSTLAAIEKDNLNYQNALQQVAGAMDAQNKEEMHQSNNIQEIKHRQQYEQQQQYPQHGKSAEIDKSKGYLTIPVAVETEGDKVLTADDINEIEKHVINVLPSLKTADKIVKLADTQLTLGDIKASAAAAAAREPHAGQGLHQTHYDEHRTTIKQLEEDLRQTSPPSSGSGYKPAMSTPSGQMQANQVNQASTANAQHQAAPVSQMPTTAAENQAEEPPAQQIEHQYYVASGPLQEVNPVDPEQVAEYNLIKNDLLNNFRYEPTRAVNSARTSSQQSASTPPMNSYMAAPSRPQHQHRPASVTRYFQQGLSSNQPRGRNYGGRASTPASSSTRTMMGGRKVSEVMRPLIHTTPVPMTSPLHVPSVEPEKVDAIQLIAGNANDRQPMVVEAHQLVNHTPDGGIDYNSGLVAPAGQHQQDSQHNRTTSNFGQHAQHQPQPAEMQAQQQYVAQTDPNQGAIIEYVAVTDQALNNAIARHQGYELGANNQPEAVQPVYASEPEQPRQRAQQQQQRQALPIYGRQQSSQSPFLYDYTISTPQGSASSPMPPMSQSTQADTYLTTQGQMLTDYNQQQQSKVGQPSLAWSPSIASEHEQQQLELAEHAGAMQQVDMPSTAGYNFFVGNQEQQQQQQPQTQPPQVQHPQSAQDQNTNQPDYQPAQQASGTLKGWRTKAGGSQPNPDAQYDGQIVKSDHEQQSASDNGKQDDLSANEEQPQTATQYPDTQAYGDRQRQHQQSVDLARIANAHEEHQRQQQQQQQQQQQAEPNTSDSPDTYQQQRTQQEPADRYRTEVSTPASTQQVDNTGNSYMSTNSYVGGAQLNHQTPSDGNYDQHQHRQQQQSRYSQPQMDNAQQYNYMKLDQDRQQNHLAKQQAQHQANLIDLLSSSQAAGYQTTTPMSLTTLAAIEQQQDNLQQVQQPDQPEVQQHNQQQTLPVSDSTTYTVQEQAQQTSGPNEAMLVNETPLHVPITDQQSLIPDQNRDSQNEFISTDDASSQRHLTQPAAVYQVYQAYYAPKDHKPLPGYVRLSLDEFNELFRDAEIQYVDRNLNKQLDQSVSSQQQPDSSTSYDQQPQSNMDMMKAAASDQSHSILIDRRSIPDSRNRSQPMVLDSTSTRKSKLNRAVRKIISIRNSQPQSESKDGKAAQSKKAQLPTSVAPSSTASISQTTTTPSKMNRGLLSLVQKSALINKKAAQVKKVIKPMRALKTGSNHEAAASTKSIRGA